MFSSQSPLTVLTADDHFVVRSGLAMSFGLDDSIRIVGEAERGEEVLPLYRRWLPRVVLLDLQLRGQGGVAVTSALLAHDPGARVLIFSSFARLDEVQAALDAGALGYVQKAASRGELLAALHDVARDKRHISSELASKLRALRIGPAITDREREILQLVANGRANKEIAAELGISEPTVKRHVSTILEKMEVSDRAEASVQAIRRGIVRLPD
jgi:DNA-binding NarL/FixJ family response regulator